jgi:hypothetical protein
VRAEEVVHSAVKTFIDPVISSKISVEMYLWVRRSLATWKQNLMN